MGDAILANSINVFSLVLLAILVVHTSVYFKMHHSNDKNIWRNVLISAVLAQIVDMMGIILDGVPGLAVTYINYFARAATFVLVALLASNLALFFEYSIGSRTKAFYNLRRLLYTIVVLSLIIQVAAMPFGAVFSINDANLYTRGPLYTVGVISMALPAFVIMYRLLFFYLKKLNQLIKSNYRIIILVALLMVSLTAITVIEGYSSHDLEVTFPVISLVLASVHLMLMSTSTTIDHLTGLQNIQGMDRYFEELPKVSNLYVAVMFFDLDKFKEINDNYGHKMGDVILQDFSKIISSEVKNKDLAARIGGDEFLLVVQADHEKAIGRLLNTIEKRVNEYNDSHEINMYYSCGIGVNPPNTKLDRKTIVEKADKHMYEVKEENHKKYGITR